MDENETASQADSVLTITDLIRAKLDTGKSVRDLARDSGDRVKYQTFDDYSRRAPKSWPKETKTIAGMALALGVTETSIVLGYAASLGVDVAVDSMLAQQLPASTVHLTPQLRNAIVALINAAAAATTEGATNEDTRTPSTPSNPPTHGKTRPRRTPMKLVKSTDRTDENQGSRPVRADWGDNSVPPPSLDEADAADADYDDE